MDVSLFPRDSASLRHVRLHGGGDALRGRQRLERLLNEVDWSPASLGPRALLVVQHMAVDARRGFAPRAEGGAFARQVSGALRERAATARRPWLHRDAAMADAVCFADEAELLACLWRDWARGTVPSKWWWGSVLKRQPAAPWLRGQLFSRGDRLVPAMALLAAQGDLRGCIQTLNAADAEVALRAVRASHALRVLDAAAAPPLPQAQPAANAASTPNPPPARHDGADRARPAQALGRLVDIVPELRSLSAAPPAMRLLAVALATQRAARWARSPQLPQALAEMEAVQAGDLDALAVDRPHGGGQSGRQDAPARHPAARPRGVQPPGAPGTPTRAPEPVGRPPRQQPAPVDVATPWQAASHAAAAPVDDVAPALSHPQATPQDDMPLVDAAQPARPRAAAKPALAEVPATAVLHTRYGGVFYLLNIALAWRLYGDFTMPRHPGISLPPWDLLAWTGRAWFGEPFEADPLWPLLAELAGRELPASPGDDFDDAPAWAPPPDAVQPCAEAVDEPHAGRRWLQHWRLAVEARLRSALGCGDGAEMLCRHRAGIAVSEAAVDVTLSLAELPLPIRFAGLDRDPGWIPAAGRSVMFHFD